ncbi:hypothetical protein GCM10010377_18060 [Streptomyces viridiviolaceus]|uniref:DUF6397 family protein n=1 Tax=Streptomyces viridiviolaceus TaxID=68282 RepID=A0ABW2DX92_9ACTN|nr:DUF6397 family protein [Streptomyces viridiviolaceus]GHB28284.1 hypothetical protein GCM10010377_18060 [Streptomyces viridiviolaceus]
MSGNNITHEVTDGAERTTTSGDPSVAPSRAARELGLKRSEFDLAVRLGRIRTVPDEGGGGRRVARSEIDRVRTEDGFPQTLRDGVRTVRTTEGAALMQVTKARFTRLARLGLLVPVAFHLNRYRAVVWMYRAEELERFAADESNAPLLTGRTPEGMRDQLKEGLDLRPRNWRGRYLEFLLRQAEDPWARAAAVASLLDPVDVSEVVTDPYERSRLNRFRPAPPSHGSPGTPAAQIAEDIMTAADPDEVDRLRRDLARAVDAAREWHPAPRPVPRARVHGAVPHAAPGQRGHGPVAHPAPMAHGPGPAPHPARRPAPTTPCPEPGRQRAQEHPRPRGLLRRLWHRGS